MSDPAPDRRRRRLGPDARREEILLGALRLFSERPYPAVSTADLAGEAGVARGLINHYFGTKRALYLEVVRRLVVIPEVALDALPAGAPADRAAASVTWFLDVVVRHRGLWPAVVDGVGSADPEIDAILAEADEIAADRVLAALGGTGTELERARLRSFFGLVRAATREWLVRGSMDRDQTHELLVAALLTVHAPGHEQSGQV